MCIEEKNEYRYDVRYCFGMPQDRPTEPVFHGGSRKVERLTSLALARSRGGPVRPRGAGPVRPPFW